jgi:hypothetical protein
VVEHLPHKCKALSSNPRITKKTQQFEIVENLENYLVLGALIDPEFIVSKAFQQT